MRLFTGNRARTVRSPHTMDKRLDAAVALGAVGVGVVILVAALQLPAGSIRGPIGTSDIPVIVAILIIVGGLGLAARRLLRGWRADAEVPNEGSADLEGYPASFTRVILVWGACLLYVIALPWVGFMLVTPVLVAALLWILSFRRPLHVVAVSVTATVLMYLLFDILLMVRLPHGPLTGVL